MFVVGCALNIHLGAGEGPRPEQWVSVSRPHCSRGLPTDSSSLQCPFRPHSWAEDDRTLYCIWWEPAEYDRFSPLLGRSAGNRHTVNLTYLRLLWNPHLLVTVTALRAPWAAQSSTLYQKTLLSYLFVMDWVGSSKKCRRELSYLLRAHSRTQ